MIVRFLSTSLTLDLSHAARHRGAYAVQRARKKQRAHLTDAALLGKVTTVVTCARLQGDNRCHLHRATHSGSVCLMKYLTTQQVALILRVTPRRVRQMACDRNILGVKFGQVLAWDHRDLPRFERRPTGRPRIAKGKR